MKRCDRCDEPEPAVTTLVLVSAITNQPVSLEMLCEHHRQFQAGLELNKLTKSVHKWRKIS